MRRYLVVTYDVTGLSPDEVDGLAGEAHAQSERSDLHPSVGAVSGEVSLDEAAAVTGVFTDELVGIYVQARSPSSITRDRRSMTMAEFNRMGATGAALTAIFEKSQEEQENLKRLADAATVAADVYALHLETGGDPTKLPDKGDRDGQFYYLGISMVYEAWRDATGSRNPFSPIGAAGSWRLAEHALKTVGTPTLLADWIAVCWGEGSTRSLQSDLIVRVLAESQGDDLVVRRTKVGGKVAYYLRERREGEEPFTRRFAADVPEDPATRKGA